MAKPIKDFDWNLVESLIMLEASERYIAERLLKKWGEEENAKSIQATIKLIQRRIKDKYNESYVQLREQKIEHKRLALRQMMWKSAEKGNVAAQIWLTKNYLNWSDKQQISGSAEAPLTLAYLPKSKREIENK